MDPRALSASAVLLWAAVGVALHDASPALALEARSGDVLCAPAPIGDSIDYYSIDLVPTRRVPGTAYVRGRARVTFEPSPFIVTVAPDGSYAYDVHVELTGLRAPRSGGYVAWVTTTEIDEIRRLGTLEDGRVTGSVAWNKFLVVVSLEEEPRADAERWSGPVAFRGMSRSGNMHTMAGHGPFQDEKCAAYGYR